MSSQDMEKVYQILLKENAQLMQHNKLLQFELEQARAKIFRMERWTSFRLGKILLESKGIKGFLLLPKRLWQLRKEVKCAATEEVLNTSVAIPIFEKTDTSIRKNISLHAEQIYEELKIIGDIENTISKSYIDGKCVLSGVLPCDHVYLSLQSWYEIEGFNGSITASITFHGSMDVIGYIYFYDEYSEKISALPFYRKKTLINIPEKAKYFSFYLRIKGNGKLILNSLNVFNNDNVNNDIKLEFSLNDIVSRMDIPKDVRNDIIVNRVGEKCELVSKLHHEKHVYIPINNAIPNEILKNNLYVQLTATSSLDIIGCIIFFDSDKKKLSHTMFKKQEENPSIPEGCESASLSLRIKGSGKLEDLKIRLSNTPLEREEVKSVPVKSSATIVPMFAGQAPLAETCRAVLKGKTKDLAGWLKCLRVATIMDEFTWRSYSPEANMLQLTPGAWHDELENFKPDMLFVESAWRGKDELWKNSINKTPPELMGILHWCRKHQVPTVFWNKEDPIHFETFINTASLFDFVFTYDFNCVARYKTVLKHNNIYYLPMGVQPIMFNPIEKYERKDAFCFAGSYYKRYPERTKDLEEYLLYLPEFKSVEIYDRQYGNNDPDYMFPNKYIPFIKGNLPYTQIDKAYKGYVYSINLNSLKQAQSLARRVYELMACNTLVVSNFSRGVHSQMGELTILSDSAKEIIRRIKELEAQPSGSDKLRLAALRKVMSESTYQDRLAYIVSKICNVKFPSLLPAVYVVACVETPEQANAVYENYVRQNYIEKYLLLFSDASLECFQGKQDVSVIPTNEVVSTLFNLPEDVWLAGFAVEDFYGANYLTDIMLATRYVQTKIICKASYYTCADGRVFINSDNSAHTYTEIKDSFPIRRAAANIALLKRENWSFKDENTVFPAVMCFSVDRFNYLENGTSAADVDKAIVCDRDDLDTGISVHQMQEYAEQMRPLIQDDTTIPALKKKNLFEEFTSKKTSTALDVSLMPNNVFHLRSTLPPDKHEYLYGKSFFAINELSHHSETLKMYLQTSRNLNVQLAYIFLNNKKQKLQSSLVQGNINAEFPICTGATFIRFALRVQGSGETDVETLFFGHRSLEPERILGVEETLVLTNIYPAYDNLYRNAFVHSRVRAYRREGIKVGVYQFRAGQELHFDEFEGVTVFRGGASALRKILSEGKVRRILVHFLNAEMWEVLKDAPSDVHILVWLHGAEIQPWTRRICNYTNELALDKAKKQSIVRMAFWKKFFNSLPNNVHLVFVSQYLANEVMEDNNIILSKRRYSIIHNPIDTTIFSYHEKKAEQRYKILSIRPFAARNYANDLTVKCILKLSERSDFDKFSIKIVGRGVLFDETVKPLRSIPNVSLEEKFLTQAEIAELHRDYGIFMVPTRIDTQGVSRDEAMASGLVPITNAVTAIPEFVDETCGILAPAEDADAMAAGISHLVDNPDLFLAMSRAAAERVRKQTAVNIIIKEEIDLIFTS
ncbi:glycosyltransferase [uncultured Mailhella sp.]|uniref:glycosyltransferase family protein n=1 Tax=uncultured Mailhella sp. TaxID=1981031 RepID=UPI0025F786AB|nr:glycosyltransferase [uncultured Mailhella sp.]